MKIAIISFSQKGAELSGKIRDFLLEKQCQVTAWYKGEFIPGRDGQKKVSGPLGSWTEKAFARENALIFVGAAGIAVRAIAPYLKGKDVDPAVLVADETGKFVISLLSGHIGGANALTDDVAELLNATPVITTATDRNDKLAVDQWAVSQGLYIHNLSTAKVIAASILADLPVGFYSEVPVEGKVPDEIASEPGDVEVGVAITKKGRPYPGLFSRQLTLLPRDLILGIGCRRGTPVEKIRERVEIALVEAGRDENSLIEVATIDLKKDEEGLLAFCAEKNLPLKTFTAQELLTVDGAFTSSEFVRSVTGVDNVCERAALLGGMSRGEAELIVKKNSGNGVTVAIAEIPFAVRF